MWGKEATVTGAHDRPHNRKLLSLTKYKPAARWSDKGGVTTPRELPTGMSKDELRNLSATIVVSALRRKQAIRHLHKASKV
jgi:hypothetical protein